MIFHSELLVYQRVLEALLHSAHTLRGSLQLAGNPRSRPLKHAGSLSLTDVTGTPRQDGPWSAETCGKDLVPVIGSLANIRHQDERL